MFYWHKTPTIAFFDISVLIRMGLETSKCWKSDFSQKACFNFWNNSLAIGFKNKAELGGRKVIIRFFAGWKTFEPRSVLKIEVRDLVIALKFSLNRL